MLGDLDYADDIYLLAYHCSDMQAMAMELPSAAICLGSDGLVGVCMHACGGAWGIQRPSHLLTFRVFLG